MALIKVKIFREDRFSIEQETDSGKYYITFPVFNGLAEYAEFYEISNGEFDKFNIDLESLKDFVRDCKNRKNDARLLEKPGRIRGEPN
ncbi:MAG: hypothetical protein HQK51_19790 [Oligoflexia bacterium]|nr:hypothetical protein [Oligoflexia bacterium]